MSYIYFRFREQKPKTKVWDVVAKEDGCALGVIRWSPNWRQYAFFPNANMSFEKVCLTDIVDFMKEETTKVKKSSVTQKQTDESKRE